MMKQLTHSTIEQAYQDMADSNLDGLMALYAPDAILQNPGQPAVVGIDELRAYWTHVLANASIEVVPTVYDADEFGDAVVVRGSVTGVITNRDNNTTTRVDSWFMQVYRKQFDGTLQFWRGANGPNPSPK